jgi:hypothetical protein
MIPPVALLPCARRSIPPIAVIPDIALVTAINGESIEYKWKIV